MKDLLLKAIFLLVLPLNIFAQTTGQDSLSQKLKSESFIYNYGNLSNTFYAIGIKKQATIAFLGGSITEGGGWRNLVQAYLRETWPDVKFHFIDAGISSLGSLPHSFRLNQDVLSKEKVDLLFLETAVNDLANQTAKLTQQRALEGIVRHAHISNPYMDVVLLAFADEDKLADYAAGKVPQEVALHDQIAKRYHLPFINLAEEVYKRIAAGEFTWKDDFKDLHPSPFGHTLYFNSIRALFQQSIAKKMPVKRVRMPLPVSLDAFNYGKGDYLDIKQAVKLQGFVLDPSWKPADQTSTRNGFVNVPMLVGTHPGDSFELPFNGTAVGIAIISGPDAGSISYSVDGKAAKNLDYFTQWSNSLHLPWYLMLADELSPGNHVLKVTINTAHSPNSLGNALRIVHFLINK
ncbi:MAG: GDSL-type esterase/lipase family protein [Sphingobacteriaceae bacterium]